MGEDEVQLNSYKKCRFTGRIAGRIRDKVLWILSFFSVACYIAFSSTNISLT